MQSLTRADAARSRFASASDGDLIALAQDRRRVLTRERLVLYAGANLPSPAAEAAHAAALGAYPAMGPSFSKEQPDTDIVSELERRTASLAASLFGAGFAEVRLPSCTIANLAVFLAFASPGALMLAPAAAHGGHLSQRRGGTPDLAGLTVEDLPFDVERGTVDVQAAVAQVEWLRPRLVLLGRSVMLRPEHVGAIADAARSVGATSIYDASHVAGLIAGGTFPNPLAAGVDLMTLSTYKTLAGRPQGLVVGRNPEDGARLADLLDRRMLANIDAARLAPLLVTLREALGEGRPYAERIVANTEALTLQLRLAGIPVIAPGAGEDFTHQFLVPLPATTPPKAALDLLEAAGILAGTCADPRRAGQFALRLGTQFATTLGMRPADMADVAAILTPQLEALGVATSSASAPRPDTPAAIRTLLGGLDAPAAVGGG